MILFLSLTLLGCVDPPADSRPDPILEWERYNECVDGKKAEACYWLKDAWSPDRAIVGLGDACLADYRDACDLLYERQRSEGRPGRAYFAAERACDHGSAEHCRIVLDFGQQYPEYAEHAESRRERNQAVLDAIQAGRPAPVRAP